MLSWQVRQARVRRERQLELARLEAERLERERRERERLERERLERERAEAERRERARLERERLEAERLEAERLEAERLEAERLERERLEREAAEAERLAQAQLEQERLEREQVEAEHVARQQAEEQERVEAEERAAARRLAAAAVPVAAGGVVFDQDAADGPGTLDLREVVGVLDLTDGAGDLDDPSTTLADVSTASTGGPAAPTDEVDDEAEDGLDEGTLTEEDLGDELDAELEAEAAEMAPLVELPDHAPFAASGDGTGEPGANGAVVVGATADGAKELTVRVRGMGRMPARKVRRVIRRVDPLSVLKLSFAFNLCLFAMFGVAAVLLWSAAIGSGSTDNIESFIVDIGFDNFKLVGADLFRGFVVFGGAMVVLSTVFCVLMALLFNLISDIVGGIRLTMIEPTPHATAVPDDAGDVESEGAPSN